MGHSRRRGISATDGNNSATGEESREGNTSLKRRGLRRNRLLCFFVIQKPAKYRISFLILISHHSKEILSKFTKLNASVSKEILILTVKNKKPLQVTNTGRS